MKIMRCLGPKRETTLYAKHNPDRRRADLDLYQLGAKHGEEFWLTSIGPHNVERFAEDYNRATPKGLENTELRWEDGLRIRVDETELRLNVRRMNAFQGKLFLDADFEGTGFIGFSRDVRGFSVRTRDHYAVKSMVVDGSDLLLLHGRGDGHLHVNRLSPPQLIGAEPKVRFSDCIQILSRPKTFEGEYLVKVNQRLIGHILSRLAKHYVRGYTKERGDIGEELIDAILSQVDCPQLMSHPLDPGKDFDSGLKGPDSLRRIRMGLLAYFEFKWWQDIKAALSDARKQASEFPRSGFSGERVAGAYIANLGWNPWRNVCSLTVSKVW